MQKVLTILFSLLMAFGAVSPAFAATDIRDGEHPYEVRRREEARRKRLAEYYEENRSRIYDNFIYYHPLRTQRSVLHPFYRKGGTSGYQDGRYAAWRADIDPKIEKYFSPDTYCDNYFQLRMAHRGQPVINQCF